MNMSVQSEWVSYGNGGQYVGYAARLEQATTPLPAVIVLQEIWGVDEHIMDVTNRFAEAGYVAFAPDLYAQNGGRPEVVSAERVEAVKSFLNTLPPSAWSNPAEREAEMAKLPGEEQRNIGETFGTLFGGLVMEKYIDQLKATSAFLRDEYALTKGQGVASVGFCMGGSLSGLLACHDSALRGAVIYYGSRPPQGDDIAAIQCPVLGFFGSLDVKVTEAGEEFAAGMRKAGKSMDLNVYEGALHAFFNDSRPAYHVGAARDSFAKTLSFFNEVLA